MQHHIDLDTDKCVRSVLNKMRSHIVYWRALNEAKSEMKSDTDDVTAAITGAVLNGESAVLFRNVLEHAGRSVTSVLDGSSHTHRRDIAVVVASPSAEEKELSRQIGHYIASLPLIPDIPGLTTHIRTTELSHFAAAQRNLVVVANKRLHNWSKEWHIPLACDRESAASTEEWLENYPGTSTAPPELDRELLDVVNPMQSTKSRPPRAPLDVGDWWDFLPHLVNPNSSELVTGVTSFHSIRCSLRTPSLTLLKERLGKDIGPQCRHLGVESQALPSFVHTYRRLGQSVLDSGLNPLVTMFLRRGAPHGLRSRLWAAAMDLPVGPDPTHPLALDESSKEYFASLCEFVNSKQLLYDHLIGSDLESITRNETYFVFSESLKTVCMAFSRDNYVARIIKYDVLSLKTPNGHEYPPSGVLHPFTKLCAPLCLVFEKSVDMFFVFRELYCRLFCGLHVLSSEDGTLVYLLNMFESLIEEHSNKCFHHCMSLGLPPARFALQWFCDAFVTHLDTEQLLWLWDVAIGFGSLDVFAIAAASIFVFRERSVLRATTPQELTDVLSRLTGLNIVSLIQGTLV